MASIFISYRRSDSADVTGRIYDRLTSHFGPEAVFKDVDSIPFGIDFRQYLDEQVSQSKVVIAVIGSKWLETDDAGKRRIDEPTDWVRLELETALHHQIPILPLLVSRAKMPRATEFPISLRAIAPQNAAQARPDPDFHTDIDRLIAGLENQFGLVKAAAQNSPDGSLADKIPCIWLHGWDRVSDNAPADLELDWDAHYQKPVTFPNIDAWEQYFAPQLKSLKQKVDTAFPGKTIEFKSTLPLAPMLAVGQTFPKAGHYKLRIQQNDAVWQSYDVAPSSLRFAPEQSQGQPGSNLLMGFGITGDAWLKMTELQQNAPHSFDACVYARLDQVGSTAISNNADVVALAIHAKDLMRQYQQVYQANCLHLVVFGPAALSLFLGQYLNQLGEIIAYEYKGTGYHPAVRLRT